MKLLTKQQHRPLLVGQAQSSAAFGGLDCEGGWRGLGPCVAPGAQGGVSHGVSDLS